MRAASLSLGRAAAGVLMAFLFAASGKAQAESAACGSVSAFEHGSRVMPAIKVYTGADGVSHLERLELIGFTLPFF